MKKKIFLVPLLIWVLFPVLAFSNSFTEKTYSLSDSWKFTFDPEDQGVEQEWFDHNYSREKWRTVEVPHTWQIENEHTDYYGIAWYAKTVPAQPMWQGKHIELEFDAIYRDARIWINGVKLGEHIGSGWTPFSFSVVNFWNVEEENQIVVRVDNRFSENALPYKQSFDWANDGGIIRDARLRILPPVYIDSVLVNAEPREDLGSAFIYIRSNIEGPFKGEVMGEIYDPDGMRVFKGPLPLAEKQRTSSQWSRVLTLPSAQLWHFDHPNLYKVHCYLKEEGDVIHEKSARFGIRKMEARDGLFYLNGEPMRLMGVEWMPGSDPRYGMAQDPRHDRQILREMKKLNCILTRFHWQQSDYIFDFMDSEGMLTQEEIPAWGGKTMEGNFDKIQPQQTREMIQAHYNHPSIYAWGLCNEIGAQRKSAKDFIRRGKELAKKYDPYRLLTFASNALQKTPEKNAAFMMDFVEWNDYYESWYGGTVDDMADNLQRIHEAFPQKPLVISEYGLCECSPKNPVGDQRRIEILKTHTDVYRKSGVVAGAIFFDYNDYRTHIGDKGTGAFQQRVHGVVDLLVNHKPSWQALKEEASPIRTITIDPPETLDATTYADVHIKTRSLVDDLPAYTLREYFLIWTAYNELDQPIGTGKTVLPNLEPGTHHIEEINWPMFDDLKRVKVVVYRPTGYSVLSEEWVKE